MLSNGSTDFNAEGFAAVVADLRRLFLLVGGGANDLNNASADVNQDGIAAGENANNAFKLRNVNISTTAPIDGNLLGFSKARNQYEPVPLSGVTVSSSGTTSLLAANNLSDLTNTTTAKSNIGLGTGNSPTFNGLTVTTQANVGSGVTVGASLSVSSGATISANLTVSSGARFDGGMRMPPAIKSSDYAALTSDYLIIVSGTTTITLPSAATSGRSYAVGAYPGATVTVSALDGTETIRGATGVALTAGRVHTFYSDGINMWLEGRSA